MLTFRKIQIQLNKIEAEKNKKYILKKLEEYYLTTNYREKIKAKEYAVFAFWQAKKQGRLDNLNRIVKYNFTN